VRAIHVENSDETAATRYFHTNHLGSIAVITNEVGAVAERLSYDAWGLRRHPDGTPEPSGSISSQSSRGFTGHEHLAEVGLIHMNGRVYSLSACLPLTAYKVPKAASNVVELAAAERKRA
jgi:hypothetical protein